MGDDGRLYCLARASGKVRWIAEVGAYRNMKKRKNPVYWSAPVLASGRIVLTNSLGQIVSVDAATGTVGSRIKAGGDLTLPPVIANRTLYLLDQKGKLSAWR